MQDQPELHEILSSKTKIKVGFEFWMRKLSVRKPTERLLEFRVLVGSMPCLGLTSFE